MSSSVPDGWELSRLSECSELITKGATPTTYGYDYVEEYAEDAVTFLRGNNTSKEGRIVSSDFKFISPQANEVLKRSQLSEGDCILTIVGTMSSSCIIPNSILPANINQNVALIRTKNILNAKFLSYLLQSLIRNQIEIEVTVQAQPSLSLQQVGGFVIHRPPLPEQKKIVSILTSVDEVIENTQKQIDKLQDLKKATMNQLLTKGIGHTEFKDSELGRIPKSWEVKKLGVFAKVKGGKRLPKGEQFSETMTEYPYIRVSDFENQGINKTRLKYVSGRVRESIKGYVISSKDLYISIAGSIGIVGTIPDELSGSLLTENAAKIVLESNVITRDFLKCNLSSEIAQSQFRQEKGTGGGVPKLALFRIEETVVALPKIDEQLQISSTIASLDKAISDMDSKLSQTQSLKKSLMQDLLTGKVRVTVN